MLHKTCGSWLACDASDAVYQVKRSDAIASKPAPTFGPACYTKPEGAGLPAMQATRSIAVLLLDQNLGAFGTDLLDHRIYPIDQNIMPTDQHPLLMLTRLRQAL